MAKKKAVEPKSKAALSDDQMIEQLQKEFAAAEREQHKFRDDEFMSWDAKEKMLLNRIDDKISYATKSQVYDPRMATIALEGCFRVMSQFPSGKVQALNDKSDAGKNVLMNTILTKYVQPNANYGHKFLTKLRMVDLYSRVYGSYAVLVEYRVDEDYIGPDIFLIPVRNLYPQAGAKSIRSAQYVFVETFHPLSWIEKRKGQSSWKNIDKLMVKAENNSTDIKDANQQTYNENQYQETGNNDKGKDSLVRLVTKYSHKQWITFSPKYGLVVKVVDKDKYTDIPIVMKHFIPLADRFWGLGQFERGKTLQYAHNSLINLHLDNIKKGLYGTTVVNPNGVVTSTLENMYRPGGFVFETIPNSIREVPFSPQGMNTFHSTSQYIISAMANMAGTPGDTSVSKSTDPTMGKTPEALKLLATRQSVADSQDAFQMEQFLEEVFTMMANMFNEKMDKPIDVELFKDDIEAISEYFPDVQEGLEVFESGEFGKLRVTKNLIGDTRFRYTVDAGSTIQKDNETENKNLIGFLQMMMNDPQGYIRQQLQAEGKDINVTEILKRTMITSGIRDWDKILIDLPQAPMQMGAEQMPGQPMPPPMGAEQMPPQAMPSQMPMQAPLDFEQMKQYIQSLGGQGGSFNPGI